MQDHTHSSHQSQSLSVPPSHSCLSSPLQSKSQQPDGEASLDSASGDDSIIPITATFASIIDDDMANNIYKSPEVRPENSSLSPTLTPLHSLSLENAPILVLTLPFLVQVPNLCNHMVVVISVVLIVFKGPVWSGFFAFFGRTSNRNWFSVALIIQ